VKASVDRHNEQFRGCSSDNGLVRNSSRRPTGHVSPIIPELAGVEIAGADQSRLRLPILTRENATITASTLIVSFDGIDRLEMFSVNNGGTLQGQGKVGATTVNAGANNHPGTRGAPPYDNGRLDAGTGQPLRPEFSPPGR